MSTFINEISEVQKLILNNQYLKTEKEIVNTFEGVLFNDEELTPFQIAFLALLSDKYSTALLPMVEEPAKQEFINYFDDGRTEQFIQLNGVILPEDNSEKWCLMFENEDPFGPISHVDMNGWEMVRTALSD
ncbi:hypothetical protein [Flammeovirga aprica]|uniref:Uncharacterized protein n=1 Tax=Flammeovirga aprica JL-4 TaxID=694437 RepID=A0A7X9XDK7_9BACT|nr:hypothetical protein [Flammeovirga aprica]NME72749.1 hypothetical protein [Flammeovirga aprica JL-4]